MSHLDDEARMTAVEIVRMALAEDPGAAGAESCCVRWRVASSRPSVNRTRRTASRRYKDQKRTHHAPQECFNDGQTAPECHVGKPAYNKKTSEMQNCGPGGNQTHHEGFQRRHGHAQPGKRDEQKMHYRALLRQNY